MKSLRLFSVAIILAIFLEAKGSLAYDEKSTHLKINESVVYQNLSFSLFLKERLGFEETIDHRIKGFALKEWIINGGRWEDEFPRYVFHFHDPLAYWDEAGLSGSNPSSLVWAQDPDDINDYSWQAARSAFYSALLTGSETAYAETFRGIGQLMHLVSDASVPSHVRNDAHPGFPFSLISNKMQADLYEAWAKKNYDKEPLGIISYASHQVDKAIFTRADLSQVEKIPISALWDQNVYGGSNPELTWSMDAGLAEFTNANFVSQDTLLDSYPSPDLLSAPLSALHAVMEDGKNDLVYYFLHPDQGYRMATWSLLRNVYGADDQVWQDNAAYLIPRAVGYSAALLDYFFRGVIEVSTPSTFVYGIIDGGIQPHQFTRIRARLRNATPGEEMSLGTLVAVARYRKRTDYRTDLLTDPPSPAAREPNYSYSLSAPVAVDLLSSSAPTEYVFDFSAQPIPAGITDLVLQVVFKGTLGSEEENAVAVGMKDLNEPAHHVIWNSTDQLVCRGALYTGEQVRNDSFMARLADPNGNGVFNEPGEPYIDPYWVSMALVFSKEYPDAGQPQHSLAVQIEQLPAARHSRIILLTDLADEDEAWLTSRPARQWEADPTDLFYYSFGGVTAQEAPGEPWAPTTPMPKTYVHRGVAQHYLLTEYFCLGGDLGFSCAYGGPQRPVPQNLAPYPVSIDFP